jgi:hypothetical protein
VRCENHPHERIDHEKGDSMKKPDNPLAVLQTQRDAALRKDQSEKDFNAVAKAMTKIYALAMQHGKLASEIMKLTASFQSPKADDFGILPKDPAPKRKPATATEADIEFAYQVLCATKPPYSALSPRNVVAVWAAPSGIKIAGAALKALVAQGRATIKRGKYAQVASAAQSTDGATSEVP